MNYVIRPSTSPWHSPVVLIKMKDTTETRFCVDFRRLNNVTVKDAFPLPNIEETITTLHGIVSLRTLDLTSLYHQILLDETSPSYTAFVFHDGLYEFNVLPFCLNNATATLQRLMQQTFQTYLHDFFYYSI